MRPPDPSAPDEAAHGLNVGQLVLLFGAGEVLVIFLLLVVESPLGPWANRAAETWGGRLELAAVAWLIISVVMIVVLAARSRARARTRRRGSEP